MIKIMRKPLYICYSLIAVCLCGITGCLPEDEFSDDGMSIRIGAKVTSSVLSRAGANFVDYDTDTELSITMIRWDEDEVNADQTVNGASELGATMGIPTDETWIRGIDFDTPQFYNSKVGDVGFAGWYPASDAEGNGWVKTDAGKVIADDNSMTYKLDGKTDVMISDFSRGNFNDGMPALTFSHALCMYNIYAYAVDEDCVKEWGNLSQVTVSNLHQQLKIQLPATFKDEWNPLFSFQTPEVDGKTEYEDYNLMGESQSETLPVGMSKAKHIGTLLQGIPAPIGTNSEEPVLYISSTTEKQTPVKVAIVRDFTPGYAYNIYLKFSSKGIINAEVSGTDWEYDGDKDYDVSQEYGLLTDLSRYGTANCYIVSSANRGYCFDATVKGNGVNTLTKRDGTTIVLPDADTNLDIDEVVILRSDAMMKLNETTGKMEPIENYSDRVETPIIELLSDKLTDGKVIFRVPGIDGNPDDSRLKYKGNVKIGGKKNGKIVWSWHIWITDKPQNQGYSNGYVALDRNLGAVTTDYKTFRERSSLWAGLYYQWGRKDPIFRPTVDERDEWKDVWPRDVTPMAVPVSEAHKSPTTYFYSTRFSNWTTDTEYSDNFWGYTSIREDIKKTLYDPCPPGYRVPGNPIWQNYNEEMKVSKVFNGNVFAGYEFSIYDRIKIYYPNTVCLAEGKLQNSDEVDSEELGNFVYLYTATPYEPELYGQTDAKYDGLAYHFRYNDKVGQDYSSVLVADPDKYHVKRSAAYPVRCVFESSSPVVTDLSGIQSANSYMVTKTGFYKFRATTRGNGVTGLRIVEGDGSFYRAFDAGMGAGIQGIDRVDVLWWQGDLKSGSEFWSFADGNPSSADIEGKCPVVMLDNGKLEDGFASFYVTVNENTYGNLGLAAYDANGKILWSWHIWITPEINDVRLGNFTVMDRNIGATYAPSDGTSLNAHNFYANLGLYYQWGRKDPFFGPRNGNTTNTDTYYWFKKENGNWTRQASNLVKNKQSLQKSVEEPNFFYKSDNTFWQTTYVNYKGEANDLWGYVGSAGSIGESFAKTMYDPCPPGYRVMQHDVFESANICNANDDTKFYINNPGDTSWGLYFDDSKSTNKGTIVADGVWFPNSKAINSTGVFVSDNYRLSTATPFYSDGVLNVREIRWTGNSIQQNHSSWMAAGRVVRCQME